MIPEEIIDPLILETHEIYGHVGAKKIICMLQEDFYIKNLQDKAQKFVAFCDSCQRNKVSTRPCTGPMESIIPEAPNDLLSIDFYGPLPTGRNM